MLKLDKARVTTPTHRYEKARVTITDDDSPAALVRVFDRRTGAELATVSGNLTEIDRTAWQVGDWLVERVSGCGCGGTTTTPLG